MDRKQDLTQRLRDRVWLYERVLGNVIRSSYAAREFSTVRNYFHVLDESMPQADLGQISDEHYAHLMQDLVYSTLSAMVDESKSQDHGEGWIHYCRRNALGIMDKIKRRKLDQETYMALYDKITKNEPIFKPEPLKILLPSSGLVLTFE